MLRLPLPASVSGITIFPHLTVTSSVVLEQRRQLYVFALIFIQFACFAAPKTNMLLCLVLARRVVRASERLAPGSRNLEGDG